MPKMNAPSVKIIDKQSVHQICSGQVVVTLATAVKELVENSLDAGATNIELRLKNWGGDLLEVIDNGSGVLAENFAALALKHHTSKLNVFADLVGVKTFGFRGEALSSLCALGNLSITTCHKSQQVGAKIEYDHDGHITKQQAIARHHGTTVALRNLFSTLPVRHKEFLRNIKREYTKMMQVLQAYCLISTDVRISCHTIGEKGKKSLALATHGNNDIRENISNVFGPKQLQTLLEFKQTNPNAEDCEELGLVPSELDDKPVFHVSGLVSQCDHGAGRSASDRQYIYVNKRPCDMPKLTRLVNEAYHTFNRNLYPFLVLNIELGKDLVDVNVTPDKRQVFLQQEKLLFATIKSSLKAMYDLGATNYETNRKPFTQMMLSFAKGNNSQKLTTTAFSKSIVDRLMSAANVPKSKEVPSILSFTTPKEPNDPSKIFKSDEGIIHTDYTRTTSDLGIPSKPEKDFTSILEVNNVEETTRLQRDLQSLPVSDDNSALVNVSGVVNGLATSCSKDPESYEEASLCEDVENSRSPSSARDSLLKTKEDDLSSTEEINQSNKEVKKDCHNTTPLTALTKLPCTGSPIINNSVDSCRSSFEQNNKFLSEPNFSKPGIPNDNTSQTQGNLFDGNKLYSSVASENCSLTDNLSTREINGVIESLAIMRNESENLEAQSKQENETVDVSDGTLKRKLSIESHNSEACRRDSAKKIKVDESYENGTDKTPQKNITVNFHLQKLRAKLTEKGCKETENETSCARTFRATIAPENNQRAEEELGRHITKEMFAKMKIVGQFNQGFIITRLEDDLFIVDQHAADEKYNFEQQQRNTVLKSQRLIRPQSLDLTAVNESVLMENLHVFRNNGFDFEINEQAPVSQRVKLVSLPVSRNWTFGKSDVDELIFMLNDTPGLNCRPSNVRKMFASRACRMSVMIGTALNDSQMKRIIGHMGEMNHPWNCPHGRPTMRHLINLHMVRR